MAPCTGDEYKLPAMDAAEQAQLAATAVLAMFDAHLGANVETRSDGCRYLLQELPKSERDPGTTLIMEHGGQVGQHFGHLAHVTCTARSHGLSAWKTSSESRFSPRE